MVPEDPITRADFSQVKLILDLMWLIFVNSSPAENTWKSLHSAQITINIP